jgi:hypothetical protein
LWRSQTHAIRPLIGICGKGDSTTRDGKREQAQDSNEATLMDIPNFQIRGRLIHSD